MSAISFLAGMGSGYLDERDRQTAQARQAKLDQIALDRAQRDQTTFDQQQQDRTDLRTAAAPVPVTESQLPGPTEDGSPMPTTYNVGASRFASQGVAQQAAQAQQQQSRSAALDAVDPAGAGGRQMQQMSLKQATEHLMNEGTADALTAAVSGASPQQVQDIYNRTGNKRVTSLQIQPFTVNDPVTGPQQSAKITGTFEDGTPLTVPDARQMSINLMGAAKSMELQSKAAMDKAEIGEKGSRGKLYDAQAAALGTPDDNNKMPEQDKLQFQDVNKRLETLKSKYADALVAAANGGRPLDDTSAKFFKEAEGELLVERNNILAKSRGAVPGDRGLGLGKGASSKQALVEQDMKSQGITNATAQIDGKKIVYGGGATPPATPPAPPPATNAASMAQKGVQEPFVPSQQLEAQAAQETAEMGDPKINRMQFSPPVAAYLRRKRDADNAAAEAANSQRSARDFARQQALRRANGY